MQFLFVFIWREVLVSQAANESDNWCVEYSNALEILFAGSTSNSKKNFNRI
jgi:hypothetical protein